MRDFTITAAPDFRIATSTVGSTKVRYYYRSSANAASILDAAADAFRGDAGTPRPVPVPDLQGRPVGRRLRHGVAGHDLDPVRRAAARTCATSSPTRPRTSGSTGWSATTRPASRSPTRGWPTSSPATSPGRAGRAAARPGGSTCRSTATPRLLLRDRLHPGRQPARPGRARGWARRCSGRRLQQYIADRRYRISNDPDAAPDARRRDAGGPVDAVPAEVPGLLLEPAVDPAIGGEGLRHLPEAAGSSGLQARQAATSQPRHSPLQRAPREARTPRGSTPAAGRSTATASSRRGAAGPRSEPARRGAAGAGSPPRARARSARPGPGRRVRAARPDTPRTRRGRAGGPRRARRTPGRSASSRRRTAPPDRASRDLTSASLTTTSSRPASRAPTATARGRARRSPDRGCPVERVQAADLGACRARRAVDDPQVAPQRAVKPPPRIGPEVGVLGDAGRDPRVGELEQQRTRARRRAAASPRGRARQASESGPEHPWVAVAAYPRRRTIADERGRHGWDAGARTSTPTDWPCSRPACGRRTTGASRRACSAGSSSRCASRRACRGRPHWRRACS